MNCFLIVPSGFSTDFSVSLNVAWSLSPGIESTSDADLRNGDCLGVFVSSGRFNSGSLTSSNESIAWAISDCFVS